MLYRIARPLLGLGVREFFHRIHIVGTPALDGGPLMVVPTHSYSIMDPIVVAASMPREFTFMAKSTLFGGRVRNWVLRDLNMRPIHRVQDGASQRENLQILEDTAKILTEGRSLIIFPEGRSDGRRILATLKNGPVTIALRAEQMTNFTLGLRMQPVGITYSNLHDPLKSTVTLKFEEPIVVAGWKDQYSSGRAGERQAIRDLTAVIAMKLRAAMAEIPDEEARLSELLASLYHHEGANDFVRFSTIAHEVGKVRALPREERASLEARLEAYNREARALRVEYGDREYGLETRIAAMLLSPFVWIGFLLHLAPLRLAGRYADRWSDHLADRGYYKLIAGVRVFGVMYLLLIALAAVVSALGLVQWWIAALIMLVVALSGLAASHYLRVTNGVMLRFLRRERYLRFQATRRELVEEVEALRASLPAPAAA